MSHHKFRADTFIPLVPLPPFKRKTFREKMVQKQIQQEVDEVKKLEVWQPAPPISTKVPQLDPSEFKKY
uniref:Uncharacterized protein n=3 Tax=Arion vulgaris TaxID=1028688 RepID=A0A0B6ZAG7_9EUPU